MRHTAFLLCIIGTLVVSAQNLSFDVASVKLNQSDDPPRSNFPLGPGNVYAPNGGFFSASNYPLVTYISFAYKITGNQAQYITPQLPAWALQDRYDIQARAVGDPTKDEMRLMMRALLADRFKLALHTETREIPVYALELVKPGQTGPKLVPHPADAPCSSTATTAQVSSPGPVEATADGFPILCGGLFGMPAAPFRRRQSARNVTIGLLANALTQYGNLDRPVVDRTGLTGMFDLSLEWDPAVDMPPPAAGASGVLVLPAAHDGPDGPAFREALKVQLGLKLVSEKGQLEVTKIDRVERPTAN